MILHHLQMLVSLSFMLNLFRIIFYFFCFVLNELRKRLSTSLRHNYDICLSTIVSLLLDRLDASCSHLFSFKLKKIGVKIWNAIQMFSRIETTTKQWTINDKLSRVQNIHQSKNAKILKMQNVGKFILIINWNIIT